MGVLAPARRAGRERAHRHGDPRRVGDRRARRARSADRRGAARSRRSARRAPVLGATFDADGWAPSGAERAVETVAALVSDRARSRRALRSREGARRRRRSRSCRAARSRRSCSRCSPTSARRVKLKDTVVDAADAAQGSGEPAGPHRAARGPYRLHREDRAGGARRRSRARSPASAARRSIRRQVGAALAALQCHLDDPATAVARSRARDRRDGGDRGGTERLVADVALAPLSRRRRARRRRRVAEGHRRRAVDETAAPASAKLLRQVAADPRTQPGLTAAIKDALAND